MTRNERVCPVCRGKFYSPEQDGLHDRCLIIKENPPNAEITEAGGGTNVESHPYAELDSLSKKNKVLDDVTHIVTVEPDLDTTVKVVREKKIKKTDKRSRAYRQSVGR